MSYIRKQFAADGTIEYEVGTLYQDGYERCKFAGPDAEREAIKAYKGGQWVLGGMRGKSEDCPNPVIDDATVWPEFTVGRDGTIAIDHAAFGVAARLAARKRRLSPGARYQVVVSFVEVGETFIGEGI